MDDQVLLDTRPILPVAETSLWNRAATLRDQIAVDIERHMRDRRFEAWVRKSKPGEYPFFVVVEMWRPISSTDISQTTERSQLQITISVEPFLENPIIYGAKLRRHQKTFEASYWTLSFHELQEMVDYLIAGGRKPKFFKSRVDLMTALLSAFIPFIGPPRNKLVAEARPNRLTFPAFLGSTGLLVAAVSGWLAYDASTHYLSDPNSSTYYLITLLGILALIVAAYWASRRPRYQAVAKQPTRSPRREHIVDSWQICVPDAGGSHFEHFRDRLHKALTGIRDDLEINVEKHQSLTPRGFEERERLVLTKGQGNLHVHIYLFGSDAFVGWDSYLNWAKWGESTAISSTVRKGTSIDYYSLGVSVHIPSEFDLMELNALAETAHRSIVSEIKAFLIERKIEADLDFRIIRGDRAKALKAGEEDQVSEKKVRLTVKSRY